MNAQEIDCMLELIQSLETKVSTAWENPAALVGLRDSSHFEQLQSLESNLLQVLKKARTWKNSSLKVNHLPPQVLALVFDFSRTDTIPSVFQQKAPPDLAIVAIASVCRYWREIALEFPNLWTNIDTGHMRSAEKSLLRSGIAPLSISIRTPWAEQHGWNYWTSMSNSFCKSLSNHSSRIRDLRLKVDSDFTTGQGLLTSMVVPFDQPAPLLEHLSLYADGEVIGTLPFLFNGHHPRLKQLLLQNINDWTRNRFRNLTHILIGPKSWDKQLYRHLYDILAYSPTLIEFYLCCDVPPQWGSPSIEHNIPLHPIKLDQLRKLYLRGGYVCQFEVLVSRLIVPQGVIVCIQDAVADFGGFHSIFSRNLKNITELKIEISVLSLKLTGMSDSVMFNFVFLWINGDNVTACLDYIFSQVTAVTTLHLKDFDIFLERGTHWSRRLRKLSSLEELTVIGNKYVRDEILAGILPFTNSSGEQEVPCPDLSVLTVICPPMQGGAIPSLAQAVKLRRDHYCSIRLLRFSQAYLGIPAGEMKQIRDNVTMETVSGPEDVSEDFEVISMATKIWPPNW